VLDEKHEADDHVTYFFNGGVEKQFPGEDRIIVPSPKDVPTYDYKPEMSAPEVREKVVEALPNYDLVILNFANPDMVGHTGVVEAGIKAVETIDHFMKKTIVDRSGCFVEEAMKEHLARSYRDDRLRDFLNSQHLVDAKR